MAVDRKHAAKKTEYLQMNRFVKYCLQNSSPAHYDFCQKIHDNARILIFRNFIQPFLIMRPCYIMSDILERKFNNEQKIKQGWVSDNCIQK